MSLLKKGRQDWQSEIAVFYRSTQGTFVAVFRDNVPDSTNNRTV